MIHQLFWKIPQLVFRAITGDSRPNLIDRAIQKFWLVLRNKVKLFFENMRLTDEMKMEYIDIRARLESINDGDYLDRCYGGLEVLDEKFH